MKHKLLTLASAAALLAACSDTSVSDANDEIKETSTVTFFVYDVLTRMPIEDVANYYRTDDKTKYTDSTGTIVWKNVELGDSYFDFQKEGYAMKRVNVGLTDDIQHDVARVRDTTTKVPMYELGVEVKGQFFYRDPETKDWKPAPNATIYVDYDDASEIYPNEIYAKTDSLGNYRFTNLAANVDFDVKSERFTVDSTVYEIATIGATAQRKGVVKLMDPMVAEVASLEPRLLSSNLSKVEVKGELKLNFSEVLEKDSVNTKYIQVKRIGDPTKLDATTNEPTDVTDVSINVSLSDDGKTITIKSASGEWADGKKYVVKFDVWSKLAKNLNDEVEIDGKTIKKFRLFTAGSVDLPGQVKGLMIDLNDDEDETEKVLYSYEGALTIASEEKGKSDLAYNEKITLKWDGFEKGVDSYNVYAKGDVDAFADYIFVGNVTDTTTDLNLSKVFGADKFLSYVSPKKLPKVVTVMVLPVNAAGEALASGAKTLEIKTFAKVEAEIKAMQENEYLDEAVLELTALYEGTAADEQNYVTKGYKMDAASTHYAASFTVKASIDPDYEGELPDGYALYYNDGDGWKKVAEDVTYSFDVPYTAKYSPFNGKSLKYDSDEVKRFKYAVVPFFKRDASCSDGAFVTEEDCLKNDEVWDKGFEVSQTKMDAKKGVFATSTDLQKEINSWQKP